MPAGRKDRTIAELYIHPASMICFSKEVAPGDSLSPAPIDEGGVNFAINTGWSRVLPNAQDVQTMRHRSCS
jgi:hypothetical protein